jgi:hypothetical protein
MVNQKEQDALQKFQAITNEELKTTEITKWTQRGQQHTSKWNKEHYEKRKYDIFSYRKYFL